MPRSKRKLPFCVSVNHFKLRRDQLWQFLVSQQLLSPTLDPRTHLNETETKVLLRLADRCIEFSSDVRYLDLDELNSRIRRAVEITQEELQISLDGCCETVRRRIDALMRSAEWFMQGSQTDNAPDALYWYSPDFKEVEDAPEVLRPYIECVELARDVMLDTYYGVVRNLTGRPFTALAYVNLVVQDESRQLIDGKTVRYKHQMPVPRHKFDRITRIDLKLPTALDDNLLAFAYVIAHEFGVHVFQQINDPFGPSVDEKKWSFAEGFADRAILKALETELMDASGARDDASIQHAAILEAARNRHNLRPDEPPQGRDRYRPYWRKQLRHGCSAFDNLVRLAQETEQRSSHERNSPTVWAVEVALKLNMAPLLDDEREELVTLLYTELADYMLDHRLKPENRIDASGAPNKAMEILMKLQDLHEEPDLAHAADLARSLIPPRSTQLQRC